MLAVFILAAAPVKAEPAQTVDDFFTSILKEGDLKHAFTLLAEKDREFIKASSPFFYSFVVDEMSEESGEFAVIAMQIKKIALTTIGKLISYEINDQSDRVGQGTEVYYSLILPLDLDFIIGLEDWIKAKTMEFEDMSGDVNPVDKIAQIIDEFSAKLETISYKTNFSMNSFVTVIDEGGEEKILLDLETFQTKMDLLEEMGGDDEEDWDDDEVWEEEEMMEEEEEYQE